MYALIMMVPVKREQALPSVPWRPSGQTGNWLYNIPNTTVNTNTYRYPHVSPDPM